MILKTDNAILFGNHVVLTISLTKRAKRVYLLKAKNEDSDVNIEQTPSKGEDESDRNNLESRSENNLESTFEEADKLQRDEGQEVSATNSFRVSDEMRTFWRKAVSFYGRFSFQQSRVASIKRYFPQPAPSKVLLGVILYFIAICSAVHRQHKDHWLSTFLEAKMPGLTEVCQETSWESFETIIREYTNREGDLEDVYIDLSRYRALVTLPPPWNIRTQKLFSGFFVQNLDSDGDRVKWQTLSESEHLDREKKFLPRSQYQLAEFDGASGRDARGVDLKERDALLPWYRIDACEPPSSVIVSTRNSSNSAMNQSSSSKQSTSTQSLLSNENGQGQSESQSESLSVSHSPAPAMTEVLDAYTSSPLALRKDRVRAKNRQHKRRSIMLYMLQDSGERGRASLQDDSIPSKLASPFSSLSQEQESQRESIFFPGETDMESHYPSGALEERSARESSHHHLQDKLAQSQSKNLGKDWNSFQDLLKEAFYRYGLFPPSSLIDIDDGEGDDDEEDTLTDSDNSLESSSRFSSRSRDRGKGFDAQRRGVARGMDEDIESHLSFKTQKRKREGLHSSDASLDAGFDNAQDAGFDDAQIGDKRMLRDLREARSNAPHAQGVRENEDEKDNDAFDEVSSSLEYILEDITIEGGDNLFDCQEMLTTEFVANEIVPTRFMSGYKFPELTQTELDSFYTQRLIPRLFLPSWWFFSPSRLQDLVTLAPLHIVLPPYLPYTFYKRVLTEQFPWIDAQGQVYPSANESSQESIHPEFKGDIPSVEDILKRLRLPYRSISLSERKEVIKAFKRLNRDYNEYRSFPKDSPLVIQMSPSLESDAEIIEGQADSESSAPILQSGESAMNEKPSKKERLEQAQSMTAKAEQSKELRSFAARNKLSLVRTNPAHDLPRPKGVNLSSWIASTVGDQNMRSDRKYNFFGKSQILSKAFVRKDEQERKREILEGPTFQDNSGVSSGVSSLPDGTIIRRYGQLPDLKRRVQRGKIHLLGAPTLELGNPVGIAHRSYSPNPGLIGEKAKYPYFDSAWQQRETRASLLGAPSQRYLVLPFIKQSDWQKLVEQTVKDHLDIEEKRLQPLIRTEPWKHYKIARLHIPLPWAILRKPLNKPFEWPVTRLDHIEGDISPTESAKNRHRSKLYRSLHGPAPSNGEGYKYGYRYGVHASAIRNPFRSKSKARESRPNKWIESPTNQDVRYWTIRQRATLSISEEDFERSYQVETLPLPTPDGWVEPSYPPGLIAEKVINKNMLFEPFSKYSWLLLYQLALALLLRGLFQYIYRISLKRFMLSVVYTELGMLATSEEFREWLEHGPPKKVYKSTKCLEDTVVAKRDLRACYDAIWFLRNKGRTRTPLRGLVIDGPLGAEKTAFVQAFAGEADVPIIVQSLDSLLTEANDPYNKLEQIFKLARQQAPCVLYLDNLDLIGRSRDNLVSSSMGTIPLFSLDLERGKTRQRFLQLSEELHKPPFAQNNPYLRSKWNPNTDSLEMIENESDLVEGETSPSPSGGGGGGGASLGLAGGGEDLSHRRLNLLLRLLIELDGVKPLTGVLVVGTSQHPTKLDPALLRPARFDRRITLQLPNQDRRVELFKKETEKLGCVGKIPWDYFGLRTATWGTIDIAAAINHSAIRAILNNTAHTTETLEHGLNCVLGLPNKEKPKAAILAGTNYAQNHRILSKDPFQISRLAFYQAGKGVVQSALKDHPQIAFLSLTEPLYQDNSSTSRRGAEQIRRNAFQGGLRYVKKKQANLENRNAPDEKTAFEDLTDNLLEELEATHVIPAPRTRLDFETRLVGLYAGKAGELFHISLKDGFIPPDTNLDTDPDQTNDDNEASLNQDNQDATSASDIDGTSAFDTSQESPNDEDELVSSASASASAFDSDEEVQAQEPPLETIESRQKAMQRDPQQVVEKDPLRYDEDLIVPLNFGGTSGYLWQSNLGSAELLAANSIIHLAIDRWYFYSQKILTFKTTRVRAALNNQQKQKNQLDMFKRLSDELHLDARGSSAWGRGRRYTQTREDSSQKASHFHVHGQTRVNQARDQALLWQERVCQELEISERAYGKWYRIYLPKVGENVRNEEWLPPDSVYHQADSVANLKRAPSKSDAKGYTNEETPPERGINDLYTAQRDVLRYNLVMSCFYTAFGILGDNREFLDLLADHLVRFEILRSHEIAKICSLYLQEAKYEDPVLFSGSDFPFAPHRNLFEVDL